MYKEILAMFDEVAEELDRRGAEALASLVDEILAYADERIEAEVEIMTGAAFRAGLAKIDNLGGGKVSLKQRATAGMITKSDADKYFPRGRSEGQIVDVEPVRKGKQKVEFESFHRGVKAPRGR